MPPLAESLAAACPKAAKTLSWAVESIAGTIGAVGSPIAGVTFGGDDETTMLEVAAAGATTTLGDAVGAGAVGAGAATVEAASELVAAGTAVVEDPAVDASEAGEAKSELASAAKLWPPPP